MRSATTAATVCVCVLGRMSGFILRSTPPLYITPFLHFFQLPTRYWPPPTFFMRNFARSYHIPFLKPKKNIFRRKVDEIRVFCGRCARRVLRKTKIAENLPILRKESLPPRPKGGGQQSLYAALTGSVSNVRCIQRNHRKYIRWYYCVA